jgi:hypothetical protein
MFFDETKKGKSKVYQVLYDEQQVGKGVIA